MVPSLRVRLNHSARELEIDGPSDLVSEWWERLYPELDASPAARVSSRETSGATRISANDGSLPQTFGEFLQQVRGDVSDSDRVLLAGYYLQAADPEQSFTTKGVNELLLNQRIRVANASTCIRRLIGSKRAFAITNGRYRVSNQGVDSIATLRIE